MPAPSPLVTGAIPARRHASLPVVIVALAFSLGSVLGCEPQGGSETWAPMWQVTSPTGGRGVLLGTMHASVDASELPGRAWDELGRASLLTTEAEVRFINRDRFLEAISLPEGESVRAAMSDEDWRTLTAMLAGVSSAEEIDRLQPWYLEGAVTRTLLTEVDSIDVALVEEGSRAGTRLWFAESWEEQVEMLNDLGFADGLELLLSTIRDPEGVVARSDEWADAYRAGDVALLERLAFSPEAMAARPRYYEEIVFARNERWLPALRSQIDAGGVLVAVGFAHMLTERGLVRLLEQEGYEVSPLER